MSTIGDTDEGKARSSVWPVYLAAAIVALVSLGLLTRVIQIWIAGYYLDLPFRVALCGIWGFLGLLTTWGLVRLRPWGWWSVVVWSVIPLGVFGVFILFLAVWGGDSITTTAQANSIILLVSILYATWVGTIALLVWLLATRRRLFFPERRSL